MEFVPCVMGFFAFALINTLGETVMDVLSRAVILERSQDRIERERNFHEKTAKACIEKIKMVMDIADFGKNVCFVWAFALMYLRWF